MESGMVFLVGAGSGSSELITMRGMELLKSCDAVVYDRLASEDLLDYVREDCECIYVGKQAGYHVIPQKEINDILIRLAGVGKRVVRLKGGDPFVFGRGGEELRALQEAKIPYEVVPGVSSSIAVPELAGIPVTYRGISRSFHVVTGHIAGEDETEGPDYQVLAKVKGTLVFLMGLHNIESIMDKLMKYGKDKYTPAAVIAEGGTRRQRIVKGTIGTIAAKVKEERINPPAVVVVGNVAWLSLQANGKRALSGVQIGITGTRLFVDKIAGKLKEEGAFCYPMSYSRVEELESEDFTYAVHHLKDYEVVVFTSSNAVHLFMKKIRKEKIDVRALAAVKLASIGSGTAETLKEYGLYVDWIPEPFTTKALADLLCLLVGKGRILLPRAKNASRDLTDELRENNKNFEEIPIYELRHNQEKKRALLNKMQELDYITFGSAEGVRGFFQNLIAEDYQKLASIRFVCIGDITRKTLSEYVEQEAIVANTYTAEGIVEAIMLHREGEGMHEKDETITNK